MLETLWVMAIMIFVFFAVLCFCFGGARKFFFKTKKLIGFVILIAIIYLLLGK